MADRKILVQIYEVQQAVEAEKLVEIGVDHIGSVIPEESSWKLPNVKSTVAVAADGGAKSSLIPLFSSVDTVSRLLDYYQPDIVHFCEVLSSRPEEAGRMNLICSMQQIIKRRFPEIAVMRSIPVGLPGDESGGCLDGLPAVLRETSDFFLTDTLLPSGGGADDGSQPVSGFVGITGTPCDWDVVAGLAASSPVPVILAGGIADDNVFDGILKTRPAGVDSCTRTNVADGRGGYIRFQKDLNKVARLVSEVRRAERVLAGQPIGGRHP